MKEKCVELLKAKFEGVSDAILGRIADKLVKTATTEEKVIAAVDGVTFQQVLESYGDSRATEAQQTAVRNYEQKYGLKDGKANKGGEPTDKNTQPKADNEETPAWVQTLINSNKELGERLTKLETERTSNSRKQQLETVVEKLPISLRKAYERTNIATLSDEEFDILIKDIAVEVTEIGNDLQAKGAVFGQPNKANNKASAGNSKEASEAETDAVVGKLI